MNPQDITRGGGLLIMGVPGVTLDAETKKNIIEIQPAGFILFGRNITTPQALRDLIDSLRDCVKDEPIITIDQEGGRVSRLRELGNEPPSIKDLRDLGDPQMLRWHGELTGKLLRLFGFNLDLCPVLDISFDDDADNSLKNRTFGKSPQEVEEKARIFTQAMRQEGILSCGKHFPSYASATVDPHHELPLINRSEEDLENCEWLPFRRLLPLLDSIMIGHLRNLQLDPTGKASTISPLMVDQVLRKKWNYEGVLITDDMDMGAILNEYGFDESIEMSIEAGNDLVLLCHRLEMAQRAAEVLSKNSSQRIDEARERVQNFKKRLAPARNFSLAKWEALNEEVWKLRVAVLGEEKAKERSKEDGKRSPVELY